MSIIELIKRRPLLSVFVFIILIILTAVGLFYVALIVFVLIIVFVITKKNKRGYTIQELASKLYMYEEQFFNKVADKELYNKYYKQYIGTEFDKIYTKYPKKYSDIEKNIKFDVNLTYNLIITYAVGIFTTFLTYLKNSNDKNQDLIDIKSSLYRFIKENAK